MPRIDTGINLYGMMNCGKTTIGHLIAAEYEWPFVDTDDVITDACGRTPGEIIADDGAEAFMVVQRSLLLKRYRGRQEVWATGGSVAKDPELVAQLGKYGVGVFLFVSADILEARTSEADRAKLANPKGLSYRDLYLEERLPSYVAAADVVVPVNDIEPPALTVERVLERVENLASGRVS